MVRYFAYIDEETINSFYNQLDSGYDLKRNIKTKDNSFGGEVKISLKNIILGFLYGEGEIRNEYSIGSNEEIEMSIKIEMKIMELLKIANGVENSKINIENLQYNNQLICGSVQVMECSNFLKKVSEICNQKIHNYEDLISFLDINKKMTWGDMIGVVTYDHLFGNGLDWIEIMDKMCSEEEKMFSFVVTDNIYPIIMDMSYKKITLPHSSVRSTGIFNRMTKFSVLGILTRINNCFYLKPLALWNILDIKTAESFIKK